MRPAAIITVVIAIALIIGSFFLWQRGGPSEPNLNGNGNGAPNGEELEVPTETAMIRVTAPLRNSVVSSPLTVRGEARGNWYFEASFPLKLLDANGKEIAVSYAEAQGEWMTTEFVPFVGTISFSTPTTPTGTLVLEKDNPSGLPENAAEVRIPIRFADYASRTPIQDAVRALLTEWNLPGVTLEAASLNNGVLTLTFSDPQHQTSGGSARVLDMRAQIEAAVKKFPEVTSVRYMPIGVFEP